MKAKQTEPKRWSLRIKLQEQQSTCRSTDWRKKLKNEKPQQYVSLQQKDRERKKLARQTLKMDQSREARMKKKIIREKTALRVRQFRLRKKAQLQVHNTNEEQSTTEPDTCTPSSSNYTVSPKQQGSKTTDKTNRREYMKLYMRTRRSNMSRQKKLSTKKKDRERKCRATESQLEHTVTEPPLEHTVTDPVAASTPKVLNRRKKYKLKKALNDQLPSSPSKFAEVIAAVTKDATPRKQEAMKRLGLTRNKKDKKMQDAVMQGIRSNISKLGKKQSIGARAARNVIYQTHFHFLKKYRLTSFAARVLMINRRSTALKSSLTRLPTKAPSRKLSRKVTEEVKQFYLDSSTDRPEKKFRGKRLMTASLRGTYKKYTKSKCNPVSWSTFRKLRPSSVIKLAKSHLFVCQCACCVNIQFKLNTLNSKLSSCQNKLGTGEPNKWADDLRLNDVTELVGVMMCEKSAQYHKAACINNTCPSCNNKGDRIRSHYAKLIECCGDENTLWKKWERQKVTQKKKVTEGGKISYKDQEVVRRVLINKSGTIKEMCDDLISDALHPVLGVNICQHLFTAQWQNDQYRKMKENLDDNTVLMVLDFGENVTTQFQDEIKSAHYGKKQITIHPIVTYYREEGELVRDAMIMVTDNLQHDHNAVHTFLEIANRYLTKDRRIPIRREIQYTDGAASQYKCASSFTDVSFASEDFHFLIQRCFYGSEHGKGEADGETGALKSRLDKAVRGKGIVINNARDLYQWASQEMTDVMQPGPSSTHTRSRRTFFLVENDIPPFRERTRNVATLPQTRKVHCVQSTGNPYQIRTRNLSCFCRECLNGNDTSCLNIEYVSQWKLRQLKKKDRVIMHTADGREQTVAEKMSDKNDIPERAASSQMQCPQPDPGAHQLPTSLERDQWVAVIYDDEWWPGIIQEVNVKKETCTINFMRPAGINLFVWPSKVDSSTVKTTGILAIIKEPPIPSTRRHYSFHPSIASSISKKLLQYLKNCS